MKFADLFTPVSTPTTDSPADAPLRIVRINEIPTFNPIDEIRSDKKEGKEYIDIAAKAGTALSAVSAPLVPLDLPFIEGQRYADAGATELSNRLDLYHADAAGPWIRRHGVLLRVSALSSFSVSRKPSTQTNHASP